MCDLRLGPFAAGDGKVFATVELEGFAGPERQMHKGAAPRRVLLALPRRPPLPREGCDPVVGAGVANRHEVGMQMRQEPALLARLRGVGL